MRTVAIASLIALGSTLCASGPSADQIAGLVKAASAIADGATITTKVGGATVAVTRLNGMATCTVDGKPYAIRIPGTTPKVAGLTTVTDTVAQQVVGVSASATTSSIFKNNLLWLGNPNLNPPTSSNVQMFQPLANLPGFAQPIWSWFQTDSFQAQIIGISLRVGPYGTTSTSFTN